ncbi:MAG: hypothetical protein IPO37_05340 [Saprospiraceae bacterium]|nr:hypothetical protein [Saprospiraceae bacterium]
MRHILLYFGLITVSVLFLSNAGGVPQGVTGSITEASHNSCGTCHTSQTDVDVAIDFKILNKDNQQVTKYISGETYSIALQVNANNNPKSYGFQLTAIEEDTKDDAGTWDRYGDKVKPVILTIFQKQRRYLNQSAPKIDGLFTAEWKAPETDKGNIVFYYAGIAVNLNGNTSGDKHTKGQFKLKSNTSSIDDKTLDKKILLYPNPAGNHIRLQSDLITQIDFIDPSCHLTVHLSVEDGIVDISSLPVGLYICLLKDHHGQALFTQQLIKL